MCCAWSLHFRICGPGRAGPGMKDRFGKKWISPLKSDSPNIISNKGVYRCQEPFHQIINVNFQAIPEHWLVNCENFPTLVSTKKSFNFKFSDNRTANLDCRYRQRWDCSLRCQCDIDLPIYTTLLIPSHNQPDKLHNCTIKSSTYIRL